MISLSSTFCGARGTIIPGLRDGGVTVGAVQPTIASVIPDRVVDLPAKAAIAQPDSVGCGATLLLATRANNVSQSGISVCLLGLAVRR
jgi:hypothetical protein